MWRTRVVVTALLIIAVAAWAAEPWKQKPFQNWDKHDVERILRNSPWAQVITVAYSPMAFTSERPETGKSKQVGKVIRDPGKDPLDVPAADTRVWNPEGVFVLRWESSRTIRRALYRQATLQGSKTTSQAQLESEPEFYELVMVAESIVRLPDDDASGLAGRTYIQGKLAGEKIQPQRVEFRRNPDNDRVVAVVFLFPRRTRTGEPTIGANEETIEFFSQVGPRVFRAKFHPRQMASAEGPDL
jgi:hypothetical protein